MKRTLILVVAFLCVVGAQAAEFEHGEPELVGMSSERLQRVTDLLEGYVERGQLTGVHVLVTRKGTIVYDNAVGSRNAQGDAPLAKDDLYRIYSMSKPITAVAAMQLYEQGKFKLTDPVALHIPEFADLKVYDGQDTEPVAQQQTMTIRHLLTHTAGFGYIFNRRHPVVQQYIQARVLGSENLEEMITKLQEIPLVFQPGERWHYSIAVDITGLLVERLSGQPFNEYLDEHIFTPLGMDDTFFSIPDDKHDRLLPANFWNGQQNTLVSQPVGPDAYKNVTFYSGGGGLISTGMDYLRFAEMLRAKGRLGDQQILGRKTIEYMVQNHLPAALPGAGRGDAPERAGLRGQSSTFGFGLGFGLNMNVVAGGTLSSEGEFSWGGAAGTFFWVDPVEDLAVVMMIQLQGRRVPLGDELKVAVLQAIVE